MNAPSEEPPIVWVLNTFPTRYISLITESLRIELEKLQDSSATTVNPAFDAKSTARLLLAISDGLAFQLIHDPQHLEDEKMWQAFRTIVLALLQRVANEE